MHENFGLPWSHPLLQNCSRLDGRIIFLWKVNQSWQEHFLQCKCLRTETWKTWWSLESSGKSSQACSNTHTQGSHLIHSLDLQLVKHLKYKLKLNFVPFSVNNSITKNGLQHSMKFENIFKIYGRLKLDGTKFPYLLSGCGSTTTKILYFPCNLGNPWMKSMNTSAQTLVGMDGCNRPTSFGSFGLMPLTQLAWFATFLGL